MPGVGSIGWGFGNGLRLEVEGDVRHNRVRQINGFTARSVRLPPAATSMHSAGWSTPCSTSISASTGSTRISALGAGLADTTLDAVHSYGVPGPIRLAANGWSTNFAYQGIFGLAFPIAAVPGLSLTAEYRFYGVLDAPSFHASDNVAVQGGPGPVHAGRGNFNLNSDYNHSLLLGVRYAFDTAPPHRATPQPASQPPAHRPVPTSCSSIGTAPT